MGSGPITSWQIDAARVETVTDFIFLGFKIIVDGDCSHEIKRHLLLRRKAMTTLGSVQHTKKQKDHFADKGPHSQSYDFSSSIVKMWELVHKEVWTPKNWYFQIVVLEKTLESPWTARRSNQSILKEINHEYSVEGLCWSSNTLATWCKEPTHWKRPWCWERLTAEWEGCGRGWDG